MVSAGVLRLSDGVFHPTTTSALGADVIYSNNCDPGYYLQADNGETYLDEGRLPSPSSPTSWNSKPGCSTSYPISGFELAYCTDQPGEQIVVDFFERYPGCAAHTPVVPTASYILSGLPGAMTPGSTACWIIQVDLTGPGVQPLVLLADADGTYQGGLETNDRFGVRLGFPLTQGGSGPVFGNYAGTCGIGAGTVWDTSGYDPAALGIGMGTVSQLYAEGNSYTGCFWTDGAPDLSFYLRLFSNACPIGGPGLGFCAGDGSATPCPCGNAGQSFQGCANSVTASGARLSAIGTPSLSQDSFVLQGSSMTNSTVLYFQGTDRMNSGLGTVLGDGLRCAGGSVVRLGTSTNIAGSSVYPAAGQQAVHLQGQIAAPGTRTYQAWYRNAANFCTPSTFNLSNGYEVAWLL